MFFEKNAVKESKTKKEHKTKENLIQKQKVET